ncbi:hypothetical protein CEXT_648611 [Caerostris extrusa]|uniref:Uncharacterized protein n=1 Tax=Caerostris extrusa TaxID=172846 RepID=A0AAV4N5L7_CAEEX|nr:hypothetical protein CEXT_648611 [Caerostris extrusa]
MSEMEVSTEGNGPSEGHLEVPSPPAVESKVKNAEKVSPEEMCRQMCTAFKEMEVIDAIVESSKRSDLQQDYVQINETLLQKRNKNVNASISSKVKPVVNSKNVTLGKVNGNLKSKTKRNASQISTNVNDSGEFRTPNKKLIAKANFTFNKESVSDDLVTKIIFRHLALTQRLRMKG